MALLLTPSPGGSGRLVTQLRTTSFFDAPGDQGKKIGMAEHPVRLALNRIEERRLPDGRRSR